jgi:hypothetical protein
MTVRNEKCVEIKHRHKLRTESATHNHHIGTSTAH